MMSDSTKRDEPFPDSSKTPLASISLDTIADKGRKLEVPITEPIPFYEFVERLIALEQENVTLRHELEDLKEVVAVSLCLGVQSLSSITFANTRKFPAPSLMKIWSGHIRKWAQEHGIDPVGFNLSNDGFEVVRTQNAKDKEVSECSQKSTNERYPENGVS